MQTIEVPFGNLVAGKKVNARITDRDAGVDDLAKQIEHKGLIHPLIVRPNGKPGVFEVLDGNRRLAAIGKLVKGKKWDGKVAVVVRDESDSEALETSLMGNWSLPMHPVDQYEVFARLASGPDKMPEADIAARFGIATKTVKQQLALGNLAPEIRDAWRAGELSAEAAQAFTLAKDQKTQASVFEKLKKARNLHRHYVQIELMRGHVRLDDYRIKFVGRDAYRKAGGTIVESLFEKEGYAEDEPLLDRLVREKLAGECKKLVAEGWGWAELAEALPQDWRRWQRLDVALTHTKAETQRLEAIEKEIEKLYEAEQFDDDAEDKLNAEQEEIEQKAKARGFDAKLKKGAGCVVLLSEYNGIEIILGVVRAGDAQPEEIKQALKSDAAKPKPKADVSQALMERVTEARTLAAKEVLATESLLAVRIAVACLQSKDGASGAVRLTAQGWPFVGPGVGSFEKQLAKLLAASDAEVMGAFAQAIGAAVDLRELTAYAPVKSYDALVAALPEAAFTQAAQGQFNAKDYFDSASAAIAEKALAEMGLTKAACKGMVWPSKKADLAKLAAEKAKAVGWLPAKLRHPSTAKAKTEKPARGKKAA